MNYCSLSDAFPQTDGTPSPECGDVSAARAARRDERRRMRKSKPIPVALLQDPDRQHVQRLPDVPSMNDSSGRKYMENVPDPITEGFEKGCGGNDSVAAIPLELPLMNTTGTKAQGGKKRYFGADPADDDTFADFVPDAKTYMLEPSFTDTFGMNGMGRAGGHALPIPPVNDVWKPLTPSGADTAFFNTLPRPGGTYSNDTSSLEKKIDILFAKLDDMQNGSAENAQMEIMMLVSTGIFVMFFMDLLVKKGR